MTNWKIKDHEIEKFFLDWKDGILKNVKGKDLLVSNNIHGTFRVDKKAKIYQSAGFAFHQNIFLRKEDINPFMESIAFGVYFVPKGKIDFESGVEDLTKIFSDVSQENLKKNLRDPELDKDYALVKAYKCWHCDFYSGFGDTMTDHIKEKHPETLTKLEEKKS